MPIDRFITDEEWLEVVLYSGKTMLNSKKANYSYGNLQVAFKQFFDEVTIDWNKIDDVLILGFGAGGVSKLIKERSPSVKQVGIEYSSKVIAYYETYFEKVADVTLICTDAADYVLTATERFDMVVVDLYQDLEVPSEFQTSGFVDQLKAVLKPRGVVVFNQVVNNATDKAQLNELVLSFSSQFNSVVINEQMGMNRFILVK